MIFLHAPWVQTFWCITATHAWCVPHCACPARYFAAICNVSCVCDCLIFGALRPFMLGTCITVRTSLRLSCVVIFAMFLVCELFNPWCTTAIHAWCVPHCACPAWSSAAMFFVCDCLIFGALRPFMLGTCITARTSLRLSCVVICSNLQCFLCVTVSFLVHYGHSCLVRASLRLSCVVICSNLQSFLYVTVQFLVHYGHSCLVRASLRVHHGACPAWSSAAMCLVCDYHI